MWTGVAGQQLKRLKTERRYLALERAECRFFLGDFSKKNGMKKPCTYCTGIHHLGFQFQKGLG